MTHTCVTCGCRFSGPRNRKTCSDKCRQQKSRMRLKPWEALKTELETMGLEAARELAKTNSAFRDYLIDHLERHEEAHPPIGPVPEEPDNETVTLIASGGFHVTDAYGERLSVGKDIDAAEASGDWSGMLADAAVMLTANRDYLKWKGSWQAEEQLIDEHKTLTADQRASGEKWLRELQERPKLASEAGCSAHSEAA